MLVPSKILVPFCVFHWLDGVFGVLLRLECLEPLLRQDPGIHWIDRTLRLFDLSVSSNRSVPDAILLVN